MSDTLHEQFGPLADLIGIWEGDKGDDIAPSDDRGTENNKFRERMVFEPAGLVQNHEQTLHALRYSTRAWRIGEPDSFHEEVGYWIWEPSTKQVMRSFIIPRGIAVIAGGLAEVGAREFVLKAENGSCTFGICLNPFLDREFKIVEFKMNFRFLDKNHISYDQDTVLKLARKTDFFHHTDKNTLTRVQ